MSKTIRVQLLSVLLLFACITVVSSVLVFYSFTTRKDSISEITRRIEATYILLLEDVNITHDFFENETINPSFFETGKSSLLNRHNVICKKIEFSMAKLNSIQQKNDFELNKDIIKLKRDFMKYRSLTNDIVRQILTRGFKDFGIEGEMRSYAHQLESYKKEIGLVNILQLRRHEKDYIIRQEEQYITKHDQLAAQVKEGLASDPNINKAKKTTIVGLIDNYSALFQRLTVYEKAIGLKSGHGIKNEIDVTVGKIENSFASIISAASVKGQAALFHLKTVFVVIWILLIAGSIITAILISKRVSRALIVLKEKISEFVKSDFTSRTLLPIKDSHNEIDILAANFGIMEQHIINQMNALKQTNKELEILFYKASHDIKTPLIAVKNVMELAEIKLTDPEARKYLKDLNESWGHLYNIINELGMVTDIKEELIVPEIINFEEVIRSVYSEFRSAPKFDNIIFSLDIKVSETFYSSGRLIKTIFRNLIENGIKYSTKRNGLSFLKILVTVDKNNMIKIIVSDNGIGIKKEYHQKIFDMFFRGTNEASGTGLGLFIVQNSLQKLNGAISVESDEAIGTTFTVLLPNKMTTKNIMERIIQNNEVLESEGNLILNYI